MLDVGEVEIWWGKWCGEIMTENAIYKEENCASFMVVILTSCENISLVTYLTTQRIYRARKERQSYMMRAAGYG